MSGHPPSTARLEARFDAWTAELSRRGFGPASREVCRRLLLAKCCGTGALTLHELSTKNDRHEETVRSCLHRLEASGFVTHRPNPLTPNQKLYGLASLAP